MSKTVRLGVIGLGMMGRHHARIGQVLDEVDFVGGTDPLGDLHRSVSPELLFSDLEGLLEAGIDAAVVAVPSDEHEEVVLRLGEAGVHVLIEKPLSSSLESALRIRDAFAGTSLVAAVGHVERYNAATQELKRRLTTDTLGDIISITTRRVGPHPDRVKDLGVVLDLATHDIDLIMWLGGEISSIHGQLAHRLGRPHEDLVEAVGRLASGAVFSMSVNWLTPTKERHIIVLGERGAFVADLIHSDLAFYSNAAVPMEWDAMAGFKGVSEGDMIQYALRKPEPLQVELANFRDAILGKEGAQIASLDEGVEVLRAAERLLGDHPR